MQNHMPLAAKRAGITGQLQLALPECYKLNSDPLQEPLIALLITERSFQSLIVLFTYPKLECAYVSFISGGVQIFSCNIK